VRFPLPPRPQQIPRQLRLAGVLGGVGCHEHEHLLAGLRPAPRVRVDAGEVLLAEAPEVCCTCGLSSAH